MTVRPGSRTWIAALAALTATTALSIDMSLPAQPTIAHELGVSFHTAQLTLSVFLAAFAIGQLISGYISDVLGRRRVLLAGLAIFTIGGVACATSASMPTLLAARAVQGLGAAVGPVVARAMVRDTQPVQSAARVLATMVAALAVAPMLAPTVGSLVLATWSWHAIFIVLAAIGVVLAAIGAVLAETRPPELRVPFHPTGVVATMGEFLRTPGTRRPTAIVCIGFAGQFSFISASPFIFVTHFHASEGRFAIYFGVTALALMAGATLGRRALRVEQPARVVLRGTALAATGGILTAICSNIAALGPAGIIAPMIPYFVGVGMSSSPAAALAMDPVPRIAGVASAVIGALQMLSGATAGWIVTRLGGGDPRVLGVAVAVLGTGTAVLARVRR